MAQKPAPQSRPQSNAGNVRMMQLGPLQHAAPRQQRQRGPQCLLTARCRPSRGMHPQGSR